MSQLQSQQIKEITDKLEQGVKDLFESDKYKNYLKTMSRFTSYSLNNTLLIAMQKPDATLVASYGTWKHFNRQVLKGSKAIKIIAPCPYKRKIETEVTDTDGKIILGKDGKPLTEESEKVLMGFKVANVFDVSCTSGEDLPTLTHKLDGTVDNFNDFMNALKEFSPVPIELKKINSSANAYYQLIDKYIVVDNRLSEMMKIKSSIHEICHSIIHDQDTGSDKDADKQTKEVQAESVAFTVCQYYGIDSSDYSFGYVAGWSSGKDLKELKASLETIRQTSQTIINGIDQKLDAIRQAKQIDLDVSISKNMDAPAKSEPTHNKHLKH